MKKKGVKEEVKPVLSIRTNIWFDNSICVLEALVEYLKEKEGLSYAEMGRLLNRDQRNIWTVYSRVRKKREKQQVIPITLPEFPFEVPTSIWHDDKLSVLEALVSYLKDEKELTYHEIGVLLNRDERNVWTVYNRTRKKRG